MEAESKGKEGFSRLEYSEKNNKPQRPAKAADGTGEDNK